MTPAPLTDEEWRAIGPQLPPGRSRGAKRRTDLRAVVAAIAYRWRSDCAWRDLPPRFPPWPTVYTYFRAWLKDGTLRELRAVIKPPKPSELPPRRPARKSQA